MSNTQDHKKPHHPKSELFTYSCDAGQVTIPYVENIPRALARKVRAAALDGQDPDDIMFGELMDESSLETLEKMTLGEYDQFTDKWNEESALKLGE